MKHLCKACGYKFEEHRGAPLDGRAHACPSGASPKWPSSIKDETRAGEVYDARVSKFWAKTKTSFKPV